MARRKLRIVRRRRSFWRYRDLGKESILDMQETAGKGEPCGVSFAGYTKSGTILRTTISAL